MGTRKQCTAGVEITAAASTPLEDGVQRTLPLVTLLVGVCLVVGCPGDDNVEPDGGAGDGQVCQCPAESVVNCGHRGTGKNDPANPHPENTIPSFLQAVAEGAQMIELDVVHSADGVLVVIHDETVNRTTDGTGCVGDLSLAELQGLDAGYGTDLEGTGVVIPTLDEALAAVAVEVNIEIKVDDVATCPAPDIAQLAQDVVVAIQGDPAPREIVVSSFDLAVLQAIHAEDDTIYLGYLTLLSTDAQVAVDNGFAALNIIGGIYDAAAIQAILDTGLQVNVWTVNDPYTMEMLLGAGVSILITDEPDLLAETRQQWCIDYCQTP